MEKYELDKKFINSNLTDCVSYFLEDRNIIPTSSNCLGLRINENRKNRANGHCIEAVIDYPYENRDWILYSFELSIPEVCPPFPSEKFYYVSSFEQTPEGDEQNIDEFMNFKPPIGLKIGSLFNKDYLSISYLDIPDNSCPVIPIPRGEFFNITFSVRWSDGNDGRARIIIGDDYYDFEGRNMYNKMHNKLRLGHFRDTSIQTENDFYFRNLGVMKIDARAIGL